MYLSLFKLTKKIYIKYNLYIKNHFGFSKIETRGTFILINLLSIYVMTPLIIKLCLHYTFISDNKNVKNIIILKHCPYFNLHSLDYKLSWSRYIDGYTNLVPKRNKSIFKQKRDINTYTANQIKKICNMDIRLCNRIVAYRNLLGGFLNMNQLKEVYGIKSSLVTMLKKNFHVKKNYVPKQIQLANCTFKDLLKHPYISYKAAQKIYKNATKYNCVKELFLNIKLSSEIKRKLIHYLK